MAAPPNRVWALVSDITRIGKFSPETFDAEWLGGATGPEVGARFRGRVRRNGKRYLVYWTTCTITRCDPGRDFAFEVALVGTTKAVEWSYHIEPRDGGSDVTESFKLLEWFGSSVYAAFFEKARTRTNLTNMQATLDRVKVVAEARE